MIRVSDWPFEPQPVPVLVHSDLVELLSLARGIGHRPRRDNLGRDLLKVLEDLYSVDRSSLVFPAFNYDFGKKKVFDVGNDPIQVGSFPESLRTEGLFSRTPVPFFSFLRREAPLFVDPPEINPFGHGSFFSELADQNGKIVLLGTSINKMTFIHHVESSQEGGPIYRYDKYFEGKVVNGGRAKHCVVSMHVRPRGLSIDYDWETIYKALKSSDSLVEDGAGRGNLVIHASRAKQVLLRKIQNSPLSLLTNDSQKSVASSLAGRERLRIEDFE